MWDVSRLFPSATRCGVPKQPQNTPPFPPTKKGEITYLVISKLQPFLSRRALLRISPAFSRPKYMFISEFIVLGRRRGFLIQPGGGERVVFRRRKGHRSRGWPLLQSRRRRPPTKKKEKKKTTSSPLLKEESESETFFVRQQKHQN